MLVYVPPAELHLYNSIGVVKWNTRERESVNAQYLQQGIKEKQGGPLGKIKLVNPAQAHRYMVKYTKL